MRGFRCISHGRVQGVWYRRSLAEMANKEGFVGYVKNLPDGTVESVVTTDEEGLKRFKALLFKGSPLSNVKQVICEPIETYEDFNHFEVRR